MSTQSRKLTLRVTEAEYKALELRADNELSSMTRVIRAFIRSLPEYQQLAQEGVEQDDPE